MRDRGELEIRKHRSSGRAALEAMSVQYGLAGHFSS